MRASLLLAAAVLPLAGCPAQPIEPDSESSSGGADTTSTAPTDPGDTQIMTSDNTMGPMTSTGGATDTTTGEPGDTTMGETTGGGPIVVEGLAHPESILHDVGADVYLIANINGAPDGDDDDGFISRVLPDGTIDELRWIDGAAADVELSAPKGMALHKEVLYVADLTFIRKFDRTTGAQLGSVEIPGAVFLNDLAVNPIGRVYVSDTGGNAIHFIDINLNDEVTTLLMTDGLKGPNGLVFIGDFLAAVAYDGSDLFQIPFEGANANVVFTFDFDALDGLVAVPDGMLVSSWDADAPGVYHLDSEFTTVTPVVPGIASPADIEVDLDRNVLLIPVLLEDRAEFHPL